MSRRSVRAGYYWRPRPGDDPEEVHFARLGDGHARKISTEVPRDYEELIRDYHCMVLSVASRAGLTGADAEDAAQTVELRFWRRRGLEDYDPERLWDLPDGVDHWDDGREAVPRVARFVTMYKTFVLLSMRGERDKANRWYSRHVPVEDLEEEPEVDPGEEICGEAVVADWVARAKAALEMAGQPEWGRAVVACAAGQLKRREDWVAVLQTKVRSRAWAQVELGDRLRQVGFGPETVKQSA